MAGLRYGQVKMGIQQKNYPSFNSLFNSNCLALICVYEEWASDSEPNRTLEHKKFLFLSLISICFVAGADVHDRRKFSFSHKF